MGWLARIMGSFQFLLFASGLRLKIVDRVHRVTLPVLVASFMMVLNRSRIIKLTLTVCFRFHFEFALRSTLIRCVFR
jgi:hypothetical protein